MRARGTAALLVLAATLAASPAPAQGPARRLLLYMTALPDSKIGEEELLVLYGSLLERLLAEAPSVAPVEASAVGRAPASAEERAREARREGADAWVWIGVGAGGATLRAQSADAASGGDVRERLFESPPGGGAQDAWDEAVREIESRFAGSSAARQPAGQEPAAQQPAGRLAEVRIRAAAGTRIVGLPGEEIVVGPEGEASLSLAAAAAYRIVATHPQYLPVTRSFYLRQTPLLIECEQRRIGRWAIELALSKLAYPSIEAAWLAVPDRLLVTLGATSFAAGVPLWGDEDDTDLPLTQVGASVDLYLGPPAWKLRPYAGVETFVRLLDDDGEDWPGIELDGQSKVGFGAALGLEMSRHPVVAPFVEYNPQGYLLSDVEQIKLYYETLDLYGRDTPWYVYADPVLLDLLNFEIGVRIRL